MSALLRISQTTAEREAYRFGSNHVGRIVSDLEDGRYWSLFTTRTAAYAPLDYGLTFEQQSTTGVASMIAKHFRVLDGTSDPRDFINGGYL